VALQMATRYLSVVLLSSVLALAGPISGKEHHGFNLTVTCGSPMPLEGPCPLTLRVKYYGNEAVRVAPLEDRESFAVAIEGPHTWQQRQQLTPQGGILYQDKRPLPREREMTCTVYLHDYFSHLTPGEATLEIALYLWPDVRGKTKRAIVRTSTTVSLAQEGDQRLAWRIRRIASQIAAAPRAHERLMLYRSVANLAHPDLIPLFIQALEGRSPHSFRWTATHRVVELCEIYGRRQALLDYLVRHGVREDQSIFELWKQAGVQLPDREVYLLCGAENPWVKLICLQYHGDRRLPDGVYESFAAEMDDMNRDWRALAESMGGIGRLPVAPPVTREKGTGAKHIGTVRAERARGGTRSWAIVAVGACAALCGFAAGVALVKARGRGSPS